MILKVLGGISVVVGFFLLIGAPGDRVQMISYANTGRLLGLILMIIGIVLIKL